MLAPPEKLLAVVQTVRDDLGGRFIMSVGLDKRELSDCYEINTIFGLDADQTFLVVRTEVDSSLPQINSKASRTSATADILGLKYVPSHRMS